MKNLKLIIAIALVTIIASACKMGRHNNRHVVISENDNNHYLKIEYSGGASFNSEGTAITSISPNGFVKYKKNDEELIAESDNNGVITYKLNNSNKLTKLDTNGRKFLAQAVKDMIKHGHNNDGK